MIRTEGKFSIYRIEHQWKDKSKWASSIENEQYFTASGDCWQQTGVHGTFDLEEAKKAFGEVVSKLDKNRKFRLVCVTIEQSKEVLS